MSYPLYQPVFLDLNGRLCVVVGGGKIAYEKVSSLLEAGAIVHVIAPELGDGLRDLVSTAVSQLSAPEADVPEPPRPRKLCSLCESREPWNEENVPPSPGGTASLSEGRKPWNSVQTPPPLRGEGCERSEQGWGGSGTTASGPLYHHPSGPLQTANTTETFEWIPEGLKTRILNEAFLAIGATDDPKVNRQVYAAAERRGKLGNAVDDPEFCNFIFGAITKSGPVQVAVSSSGCSPLIAQRVRDQIEETILSEELGVLAEFLGKWRPAVKDKIAGYEDRKRFWQSVLASKVPLLIAEGSLIRASEIMEDLLDAYRLTNVARPALSDNDGHLKESA